MGEPMHEESLPDPTMGDVVNRVYWEAMLDTMEPKHRRRWIERADELMAVRKSLGGVSTFRPTQSDRNLARARLHAFGWHGLFMRSYSRREQ